MFGQARLALLGAISIGWAIMVHPTAIEAHGGQNLASKSSPGKESDHGYGQAVVGEGGRGRVSEPAVFAYVPAAPASLWTNDRLKARRSTTADSAETCDWGYWIGTDYWGVVAPLRFGGFPFWYASLDDNRYDNPYHGSTRHAYGQFDDGMFIPLESNVPVLTDTPFFAAARGEFYAGNYQESLRDVQHATIDMPASQSLQQFHALVLFARGDYQRRRPSCIRC